MMMSYLMAQTYVHPPIITPQALSEFREFCAHLMPGFRHPSRNPGDRDGGHTWG